MKTIIAILFLCSVAGSQVKTVHQSSKQPRCYVYSRHGMNQCIKDKKEAAELLAQEDAAPAGPMTIELPKPSPNISIVAPGGKTAVTINTDTGEIKYGEGVTPSEAAKTFYEVVGAMFRTNNCAAQAGAHSEATGKPDSEKPEKKLP